MLVTGFHKYTLPKDLKFLFIYLQVCKKYGLDKPSESNQPNAWEFLISEKYGLVWCNVFKAASSTWFYNFNLLAGFSEKELLQAKDTPIHLARKRYSRCVMQGHM